MSTNDENDDNNNINSFANPTKNKGPSIQLADLSSVKQDPAAAISLMPMAAAATATTMIADENSTPSNELWSVSGSIFYLVFFTK